MNKTSIHLIRFLDLILFSALPLFLLSFMIFKENQTYLYYLDYINDLMMGGFFISISGMLLYGLYLDMTEPSEDECKCCKCCDCKRK